MDLLWITHAPFYGPFDSEPLKAFSLLSTRALSLDKSSTQELGCGGYKRQGLATGQSLRAYALDTSVRARPQAMSLRNYALDTSGKRHGRRQHRLPTNCTCPGVARWMTTHSHRSNNIREERMAITWSCACAPPEAPSPPSRSSAGWPVGSCAGAPSSLLRFPLPLPFLDLPFFSSAPACTRGCGRALPVVSRACKVHGGNEVHDAGSACVCMYCTWSVGLATCMGCMRCMMQEVHVFIALAKCRGPCAKGSQVRIARFCMHAPHTCEMSLQELRSGYTIQTSLSSQ
eukprot:855737-Pelagomonas_calceolata.AAC.1